MIQKSTVFVCFSERKVTFADLAKRPPTPPPATKRANKVKPPSYHLTSDVTMEFVREKHEANLAAQKKKDEKEAFIKEAVKKAKVSHGASHSKAKK